MARQSYGTDLPTSSLPRNNKMEATHSDAAQNDSAANRNTNTTALEDNYRLPLVNQQYISNTDCDVKEE